MTDKYYEKLFNFCIEFAEDISYWDEEGCLQVTKETPSYSNFPWLYLNFKIEGCISLAELNEFNKQFLAFTAINGGHLEKVSAGVDSRTGFLIVSVKMTYVPEKPHV